MSRPSTPSPQHHVWCMSRPLPRSSSGPGYSLPTPQVCAQGLIVGVLPVVFSAFCWWRIHVLERKEKRGWERGSNRNVPRASERTASRPSVLYYLIAGRVCYSGSVWDGGQATQTPDDADTCSKDAVTEDLPCSASSPTLFRLYVAFRASLSSSFSALLSSKWFACCLSYQRAKI